MEPSRISSRPDLELVSPFIMATVETFRVQYSLELTHRDPYKRGEQPGVTRDLVAAFGVFSHQSGVNVSFCFPDATYRELIKQMGLDISSGEDRATEDGIRELVNVVFGKVKKFMNTDGRLIQRTIPTMILGKNLKVWYLTTGTSVVIPFHSQKGDFEIELTLER